MVQAAAVMLVPPPVLTLAVLTTPSSQPLLAYVLCGRVDHDGGESVLVVASFACKRDPATYAVAWLGKFFTFMMIGRCT